MDDFVRCCSDTRYFTERPRNLPLLIGSEGKLFDMFCFALTGYPRGMAEGLYTSPRFTIYTTFHSVLFSSTNHLHSEGDNVRTYTNLYTPIRSATLAVSPFSLTIYYVLRYPYVLVAYRRGAIELSNRLENLSRGNQHCVTLLNVYPKQRR